MLPRLVVWGGDFLHGSDTGIAEKSIEVMKNPLNMCGFPEMVVPQNGLFTMEISIKIDD